MSNIIYYLSKKVIPIYECSSRTYYLADICRDNTWVGENCGWPIKRFYLESTAEYAKEYYEGVEKSHPSYKDAKVIYEVVTECPYDTEEAKDNG